jgi:hypothetical protein
MRPYGRLDRVAVTAITLRLIVGEPDGAAYTRQHRYKLS